MLRIIKGFVIASVMVLGMFALTPVVSATAAIPNCPEGYVEVYPACVPESPKDSPQDDPAAQGNAPIGGGRNASDGPGVLTPAYVIVHVNEDSLDLYIVKGIILLALYSALIYTVFGMDRRSRRNDAELLLK